MNLERTNLKTVSLSGAFYGGNFAWCPLNSCEFVTKALKAKDGKVTLVGFGTFSKAKRTARKSRNLQTGAVIKIKASTVVKFKAGKKLKEAV